MTKVTGSLGHLGGRTAPVRPSRMRMAIAAQCVAHCADRGRLSAAQQLGEVLRILARDRLGDDLRGRWANPRKRLQRAVLHQTVKLTTGQSANNLGSTPESADPVGRSPSALQLECDLPQRPNRFHNDRYTPFSEIAYLVTGTVWAPSISRLSPSGSPSVTDTKTVMMRIRERGGARRT